MSEFSMKVYPKLLSGIPVFDRVGTRRTRTDFYLAKAPPTGDQTKQLLFIAKVNPFIGDDPPTKQLF